MRQNEKKIHNWDQIQIRALEIDQNSRVKCLTGTMINKTGNRPETEQQIMDTVSR